LRVVVKGTERMLPVDSASTFGLCGFFGSVMIAPFGFGEKTVAILARFRRNSKSLLPFGLRT
jgi:hypothetical protein